MAEAQITITLEGRDEYGGDVRLADFIAELSAIKTALKQVQRSILKSDVHAVDYTISNLSHSSPSTVTVAINSREPAFKEVPRRISRRFTSTLRLVRSSHRYAERIDTKTLESFKGMTAPINKHIGRLVLVGERQQAIQIDREFERKLDRLLEADEQERDELVGRVERLDIHNKNQFDIYPSIGANRVRCTAPSRFHDDIVKAAGRIVAVDGWALYRKDSSFPYAMKVEGLQLMEEDEKLPRMSDLHGMSPDATGGIRPEEFVRKLRDANW